MTNASKACLPLCGAGFCVLCADRIAAQHAVLGAGSGFVYIGPSASRAARGFGRITHAENIQGNAFSRVSVIVIQNKTAFL